MVHDRDITIDILRGIAIFTMVASNLSAVVLVEPHPFWLRVYGSFAAPLFILLAGMMVVFAAQTKEYSLKYFLSRGSVIIIAGALVDILIWNICPFMTVDVLYLIGISIPIAYFVSRLNTYFQWIIVLSIFLLTPILQTVLGYTDFPTEYYIWGEPTIIVENQTNILNHWLVDGWFPVFPWMGFSLLGVIIANIRWKYKSPTLFGKKNISLIGICILGFGSIIWWHYPGKMLVRAGYGELFYPPTIGYIISTIGLIVLLFSLIDYRPSITIYKPLQVLGQSSLFMYILHLALIKDVIAPIWSEENLQAFLVIYIALSSFLILVAYGLRALKNKWKIRPFVIRVLFGG
ncbi:MAG: DUF1624 domain-containing protein [Methanothrix sp.]|nr:heparan-alpha-glucosaminide N-acetyltransferase domain-containing protein [Methanothrix sp.]MCX8207267.1 DUF1624 domain-containing protein [Methanothrix sp.]